mgnify:CR=1 FL=1
MAWEKLQMRRNISMVDHYIWCTIVSIKISFFVWQLLRGFQSLDSQPPRRGLTILRRCHCSSDAMETPVHLFLEGLVAIDVWNCFGQRFGLLERSNTGISSMLLSCFLLHPSIWVDHIRVAVPLLVL